jgi:integrase/recombinase XerD
MTVENQIKDFRKYLVQIGYSKSSCYMLPECVKDFLVYIHLIDPKAITSADIVRFYEHLQTRPHKKKVGGLSEAYINHHVYALKVFFNWLEQTGQISYNPISVMKFKSPKGNPREPLTQMEIQQLFTATQSLKEKAVLHLFYSCGLRRSEGETLNIQDIHFKKQILYVREGKGAKRRAVPMTDKVSRELESYYLKERIPLTKVQHTEAFILNRVGQRMSGEGYNKLLKQIIARTEIIKEASLHHLRHSIATHLLESGLEIEKVRDFLGHGFLETTQLYTKVNTQMLKRVVREPQ